MRLLENKPFALLRHVRFTPHGALTKQKHYENLPMQYTEIVCRSAEAVLTSTHNLCFGAKIRKIGIPQQTPVLLYKSGV